jgi:hypothetical protein
MVPTCQRGIKIIRYVVSKLLLAYHEKGGNVAFLEEWFLDQYMTLSNEMIAL